MCPDALSCWKDKSFPKFFVSFVVTFVGAKTFALYTCLLLFCSETHVLMQVCSCVYLSPFSNFTSSSETDGYLSGQNITLD